MNCLTDPMLKPCVFVSPHDCSLPCKLMLLYLANHTPLIAPPSCPPVPASCVEILLYFGSQFFIFRCLLCCCSTSCSCRSPAAHFQVFQQAHFRFYFILFPLIFILGRNPYRYREAMCNGRAVVATHGVRDHKTVVSLAGSSDRILCDCFAVSLHCAIA